MKQTLHFERSITNPAGIEWVIGSGAEVGSDLYYNGGDFADAFMRWDNPKWERDVDYMDCARVITDCATYEHDLELNRNWFQLVAAIPYARDFCTTWSDLPDYYDDCPTADVPDWGNDSLILSFGTHKAPDIEHGRDYYGFWRFHHLSSVISRTSVRLLGQEGEYRSDDPCGTTQKSIWCIFGEHQRSIVETNWARGTPNYVIYSRP